MTDAKAQFLDLSRPHARIYRVFRLKRLYEMFDKKQLALVRPRLWDDPFENSLATVDIRRASDGRRLTVTPTVDTFFGQCWTLERKETDATWRIWSPDRDGVRVSTTASRLLFSIYDRGDPFRHLSYFVGRVRYYPEAAIVSVLSRHVTSLLLDSRGRASAAWRLAKRVEFRHEREVRLLYRDVRGRIRRPVKRFAVDPVTLIDEILIDPRMAHSDALALEQHLRHLGFRGAIRQSTLYQAPALRVSFHA